MRRQALLGGEGGGRRMSDDRDTRRLVQLLNSCQEGGLCANRREAMTVNSKRVAAEMSAANISNVSRVRIVQPLYINGVTLAKINMTGIKSEKKKAKNGKADIVREVHL